MDTFYAIKQGQGHTFDTRGKRLMVTKLVAKPLTITQVKNADKDGYAALQLAIGEKRRINKPLLGHLKAAKVTPAYIKEVRMKRSSQREVGEVVEVNDVLHVGDMVTVSSTSKGKGFAGGMKRYGFSGGPRTHGQSDRGRAPGSIGQGTTPGRVWKGKRMAGRMGNETVTSKGGQVVFIDKADQELWITGTIAGAKGTVVKITKVGEREFPGLLTGRKKLDLQEELAASEAAETEAQEEATEEAKESAEQPKEA